LVKIFLRNLKIGLKFVQKFEDWLNICWEIWRLVKNCWEIWRLVKNLL